MTTKMDWLAAFPLRPATEAVDALCESWRTLAARYRPHFHPKSREPELTRVLKAHVENVTGRARGLLGMWATEGLINTVNFATGKLTEERRTDIVYGWNDDKVGIQLVFEFKKVNRLASSRKHYLGQDGLLRFVTGVYGKRQPVAAMMGILTDPFDQTVPPLRDALSGSTLGPPLRLKYARSGLPYDHPSRLFLAAEFDTEHDRPEGLAPPHGSIRVAHFFLPFGYSSPKLSRAK